MTLVSAAVVTLQGSGSDPDGGALFYSWRMISGSAVAVLSDPNISDPTLTIPALEEDITLTLELVVTEEGGLTATDELIITAKAARTTNGGGPGGGSGEGVDPGGSVTLDGPGIIGIGDGNGGNGGNGGDGPGSDGDRFSYQWRQAGGPSVTLSNADSANPTYIVPETADGDDPLIFEVTVIDEETGEIKTIIMRLAADGTGLENLGERPTADAGSGATVNPGGTITLDGSGSSDPEGETLEYSWAPPPDADIELPNPNAAVLIFPAPALTMNIDLTFTLTVTDENGLTATDEVTITALAPLAAVAGEDRDVLPGGTVTLQGSGNNPGGEPLGYSWESPAGTGITLSDANVATPTFAVPVVAEDTTFTFTLTVTDENGLTATDEVSITVRLRPSADAGEDQNVLPGDAVALQGSGTDPGGSEPEYSWMLTSEADIELSDASSAAPTFIAPDVTEDTAYAFMLTVTDEHGLTATDEVAVTVRVPPTADAGEDQDVLPRVSLILQGSGSDPGGGEPEYLWTLTAGSGIALFGAETATPDFRAPATTEDTTYTFMLTVTDEHGLTATDEVTITVRAPAMVDAGEDRAVSARDTVTLQGSGRDPGGADGEEPGFSWAQTAGPEITLSDANVAMPTFTAPDVAEDTDYAFVLTVTDGHGLTVSDGVTITVRPFSAANAGMDQNVLPGVTVTLQGSTDNPESPGLEYAWEQTAGDDVTLSDADVAMVTFTAPDVTLDTEYAFVLTVTDDLGVNTDDVTVTVRVPPTADAGEDQPNVASRDLVTLEGSGSDPGGPADEEPGYSWTTDANIALSDANVAMPTFTAPVEIAETAYVFTLTLTDEHGLTASDEVTITVHPPARADAGEDQDVTSAAVVTLDGSGSRAPGGGEPEYTWEQTVGEEVTLSDANVAMPTFTALIASVPTTYVFTLSVNDKDGTPVTDEVRIAVSTNRAPVAIARGDNSTEAGGTVILDGSESSDPDGDAITYSWTVKPAEVVTLENADAVAAIFSAPAQTLGANFVITLTVTDAGGATASDTVSIKVAGGGGISIFRTGFPAGLVSNVIRSIAISDDGNLAVSGGMDGAVRLWYPPAGQFLKRIGRHHGPVYAVAISGDGSRAISGGHDGTVRLWDTDSGEEITYDDPNTRAVEQNSLGHGLLWVYAVALNYDGRRAAAGGLDGTVRFWNNTTTGTGAGVERQYAGSDRDTPSLGSHGLHSVYSVSMSVDGGRVLSGGSDGTVRLWDALTGDEVYNLADDDGPMGVVFDVELSGNGAIAVSGSADNHVHVWFVGGTNNGQELYEIDTGSGFDVTSVAWHADGILSAGGDGHVRLWNRDATLADDLRPHTDYVWATALSGNGEIAASVGADGLVHFWNVDAQPADTTDPLVSPLSEPNLAPTFSGDVASRRLDGPNERHEQVVRSVALSADGRRVMSGDSNGVIHLWDTARGNFLRRTRPHTRAVWGVSLSGDGRIAVSGSDDNSVRLWDVATGDLLYALTGQQGASGDVKSVAMTPDGRVALSGGTDGNVTGDVKVWGVNDRGNIEPPSPRRVDDLSGRFIDAVAVSADGKFAASGGPGEDDRPRIWDVTRNVQIQPVDDAQIFDITSVALSVDGNILVSGSKDIPTGVRAWRQEDDPDSTDPADIIYDLIDMERAHSGEVLGVAVSGDGRLALSGSRDNTVRLWDVQSGKVLRTMQGHASDVSSVALSADGRLAASGSFDRYVRLWHIGRSFAVETRPVVIARTGDDLSNVAAQVDSEDEVTLGGGADLALASERPVAYYWRQMTGPLVPLTGANTTRATFSLDMSLIGPATLDFQFVVTDSRGLTAVDEVSVGLVGASADSDDDNDEDPDHAIRTQTTHAGAVRGVAVSRDGSRAVSGGIDGTVRFWNAYTGEEVTFSGNPLGRHEGAVYAVGISGNGARAISGGNDGRVRLWDTGSGEEITYGSNGCGSLGCKGTFVYGVALNRDGTRAVSGGFDGGVRFWNTESGQETVRYGGDTSDRNLGLGTHTSGRCIQRCPSIYAVSISDDGSRVLSGSIEGTARLWDTSSGAELYRLDAKGPVFGVALSGDGNRAVTGAADNRMRVWNVTGTNTGTDIGTNTGIYTGTEIFSAIHGAGADVSSVALSTDGEHVASVGGDGAVRFFNVDAKTQISALRRHTDYVWAVALRGNDGVAISGGADADGDGRLQFWNTAAELEDTGTFRSSEHDVHPNDRSDVSTRTLTRVTNGHGGDIIRTVAISGDGRSAVSGDNAGRAVYWNVTTGSFVRRFEYASGVGKAHGNSVYRVGINGDGSLAVTGGSDSGRNQYLRIWNTANGSFTRRSFSDQRAPIRAVAMSRGTSPAIANNNAEPGGHNIIMLGTDYRNRGIVSVWKWKSDKVNFVRDDSDPVLTQRGDIGTHWNFLHSAALSEDGSIGMSSGEDHSTESRRVKFWRTTTTAAGNAGEIGHNDAHGTQVRGVSLNAAGTVGASGGNDNVARIWDLTYNSNRSTVTVSQRYSNGLNVGGNQDVYGVSLNAVGHVLLAGSDGGHLQLWDVRSDIRLRELTDSSVFDGASPIRLHGRSRIRDVSISADGHVAISGGRDGKLILWRFGRSRPVASSWTRSSGSSPPSLTGTAPRSRLTTASDGSAGAPSPSSAGGARQSVPASNTASNANAACTLLVGGDAGTLHGQTHGAHCVYPAALLGADNPLEADMTIPALPSGGAHVFQGSLMVGRGGSSNDAPTLTIEAGATLAFEGAASSLTVNQGARLLAAGTAEAPITFTSRDDVESADIPGANIPGQWGGIQIHGDSHQLEFVVVKHAGSSDVGGIELHDVGSDTVVQNLQVYAAPGDGLVLTGGAVDVENFVAVHAGGNSIDVANDWSGSLTNALVIQPEHGGAHCLEFQNANSNPAQGHDEGPRATITGLTCITSSHTSQDDAHNLGAGIRLGAGTTPVIKRSMVVGSFADDTDARLNYCLHIDGYSPQTTDLDLGGNVFACEDKVGDMTVEAYVTSRNNQFADVEAPTDPTSATDTQLQLLGGTPPVYSLDYDELRVNGTDATVTSPDDVDFPGAASESAAPSWLRPGGVDWTYGIFEGSRPEPLWFESSR